MLRSHLRYRYILGLLTIVTCFRTPPAAASLLWNNGNFALDQSAEISLAISADDFRLNTTQTLTGVRFWASSLHGPFTDFSGTVGWALYTNNIDRPGTLILAGVDSTPVLTNTGQLDDFNAEVIQIDISIGPVVLPPAGILAGPA